MSSKNTIPTQSNIFVYGDMLTGQDNKFVKLLNRTASYIGIAFVEDGEIMKMADYRAAMTHTKKTGRIMGRLYRLKFPDLTLKRLDNCKEVSESFPDRNNFCRDERLVYTNKNTALYAWVYLATKTNTAKSYSEYMRGKIKSIKREKSRAYQLSNKVS